MFPNRFLILACSLSIVALSGCSSRVPFTKVLISEYQLTPSDQKSVQYFISDDLLLEQNLTQIDKNVDNLHSLKKTEDHYVKQIYFKQHTPCIVTVVEPDRLKVAFEEQDALTFTLHKNTPLGDIFVYDPDKSQKPGPIPKESERAGNASWKVIGEETYKDTLFSAMVPATAPHLIVDYKILKKKIVDTRAVPGLKPRASSIEETNQ